MHVYCIGSLLHCEKEKKKTLGKKWNYQPLSTKGPPNSEKGKKRKRREKKEIKKKKEEEEEEKVTA